MQPLLPVTDAALARGLVAARIRGRFDRHRVGATEWIFDVAHNPASAALLDEALRELPPASRTLAVFGAMGDKDLHAVLAPFVDRVDAWFVGAVESDRGADPAALAALLASLGAREIRTYPDIDAAARAALATPADRVLAFGSFYTVGPAMAALAIY
jgi:dihydrofolate synthase/folylpolyglutamate synthase